MSDRRYSTARWQRLRKAVLAHYGYVCQIQGPRCTGYATTVHHILPTSQYPELFWNSENLEAACSACNYGDGARVAAQNTRATIERLHAVIEEQEQRIAQMAERLARYEDQAGKRAVPAIH
jgi:5-methylcytosine-specific restriction endonuclease McrA